MAGIVGSREPRVFSDISGLASHVRLSVGPSVNWPFEISVVLLGGVFNWKPGGFTDGGFWV